MNHKRSHQHDICQLKWLQPRLEQYKLDEINKSVLEGLALEKEAAQCSGATINRMFNLIGAILNRAVKHWEWLDHLPIIPRRRGCDIKRERWITELEAARLLKELPPHLRAMAKFTLATGLRASNVRNLKWTQIDLKSRHVSIPAAESKNNRSFGVPLNQNAIDVIREQLGKHDVYVFTYQGAHILKCSTRAWKNALKRAGIVNFRWHDLRHTWASWHVIKGTSLYELKELGNWRSFEMVTRYAHLNSARLKEAADRLGGAELVQRNLKVV